MSEIRVGLSFPSEASDIAKVVKEFLTKNKIDVVEMQDLPKTIDTYLKSELLALVVGAQFIDAVTYKFSELVLGPRDSQPAELLVHTSDGIRSYPTDEVYSDIGMKTVFRITLSGEHWPCLLLLEILYLDAYHQYAAKTLFAGVCLSILRGYLYGLVNQNNWDQAATLLSKLRYVNRESIKDVDLPSKVYVQLEEVTSGPIDPETAPTTLAFLKFVLVASPLFPKELLSRAAEKWREIDEYLKMT